MEPPAEEVVAVLPRAIEHAGRLGHRYIGGEHLLLALTTASQPAGEVLREHGVTARRVEEEIARRPGPGTAAGLFSGLDRNALAAIGIDLDAVRARIESSFPPPALAQAGQAIQRAPRTSSRHTDRDMTAWLIRRWHRRHRAAMAPIPLRAATGLWRRRGRAPVFMPFTPSAQQSLLGIRHEARAHHDARPGLQHLALALLAVNDGPVPAILSALGVSAPALRAAILDRYRLAS